jgi:hypothetical protein
MRKGLVVDAVLLPIPGFGELVDAACDLPDPHPDRLPLALGELAGRVAIRRDAHLVPAEVEIRKARTGIDPFTRPCCSLH